MRCYNPKAASAISDCLLRDGPIPCALAIRTNVSTPSGIISVSTGRRIRDCASIIFCSTPNWRHDSAVPASIAGSATGPAQATTRRPGSSWIWARRRKERNGSIARSSGPTLRQRLRLVAIAGKATVANDRCQHGYLNVEPLSYNKQRAGTVCPAQAPLVHYNKDFSQTLKLGAPNPHVNR